MADPEISSVFLDCSRLVANPEITQEYLRPRRRPAFPLIYRYPCITSAGEASPNPRQPLM